LLALRTEIAKAVVGQDAVVSGLVIALLCRGHVLLEGVPGVAKTLLVRTLAAACNWSSNVQFLDLMRVTSPVPWSTTRTAEFEFTRVGLHQPVAGRRVNRTPPKTRQLPRPWRNDRSASGDRGHCPTLSSSRRPRTHRIRGTYQLRRRNWIGSC
jgi:MoxR-like ATPase